MHKLKLTSWNIKWLEKLLPRRNDAGHKDRWNAILNEIRNISPHILCIVEGPKGREGIETFASALDSSYTVVPLKDSSGNLASDSDYRINGSQWVWFLVRDDITPAPSRIELLQPSTWFTFTEGRYWNVHYWGDFSDERHKHYRTPQVLIMEWDRPGNERLRVEFIGLHLKSKHIGMSISSSDWNSNPANDNKKTYIQKAIKARIKLSTEALDVRRYIDRRFSQEANPAIFVLGDLNDGPGKELFEREYLFFDLVSNIQGDVFFSRKFLNHALFDYPQDLRWTSSFQDNIDPQRDPRILLDHIMFTQGLTQGNLPITIESRAGFVEHTIHDGINASLSNRWHTSDHRPVSCIFTLNL